MTSTAPRINSSKSKATTSRCSPARKNSNAVSEPASSQAPAPQASTASSFQTAVAVVPNKQTQLIALLQRPTGATLTELINATGWQAHSIRGVISGVLRKKLGLVVISIRSESDEPGYRIEAAKCEDHSHAGDRHEKTLGKH